MCQQQTIIKTKDEDNGMKKSTFISVFIIFLMIFTVASFYPISAQQTVEDQYWEAVKDSKNADDFKSYLKEYPNGKYASIARLKLGQKPQNPINTANTKNFNYLVTPNSAGDIRLGMTIAEARKVFKSAKFEQFNYSEEGTWVEVTKGRNNLIRLITDQKINDDGDNEGQVPIVESAKIETIEFSDKRYKTSDGIHPEMTVMEAEQKFGKITKIELWEYDGSEHAEFSNAPKSYSFTITPKEGAGEDALAGIYGQDEYSTKRYNSGAYISIIRISKPDKETSSTNKDVPKFEDYPAGETYSGNNSSLILDSFGTQYRTRLESALKNGKPTFAGKYIVTGWGCGTGGCNTGAIIDAKTGQAYPFPVNISSVNQYDSEGVITAGFQDHQYQLNSRLMIFSGNLEGTDNTDGNDVIEFYEFKDGKFVFIKSMPYGKGK
jgi:hypothetical protein